METEVIKYKLQKFFEGESSLEDEQILHNYFRSDLVDPQLLMYRTLFTGLEKMTKTEPHASGERLMDFIIEYEQREKIRYRRFWQIVTAMAAALLIALLVVPPTDRSGWKDTYTDPDQAYTAAVNTLQFVAGKYQEGIARLQPVQKLNQAYKPMTKSLDLLNKGFQEMQKFENLNEKLNREKQ